MKAAFLPFQQSLLSLLGGFRRSLGRTAEEETRKTERSRLRFGVERQQQPSSFAFCFVWLVLNRRLVEFLSDFAVSSLFLSKFGFAFWKFIISVLVSSV